VSGVLFGESELRGIAERAMRAAKGDQAEALVQAAHQVCPYSNATRGNIEVALYATV